jgi:hypothetical protein
VTLALFDLYEKVRGEFRTWHPNDETTPITSSVLDAFGQSLGILGYLSESGTVTLTETATLLGIIDGLDEDLGVAVMPYRFCFGRRERTKQINQGIERGGRIVFDWGDPSGALGKEVAAQKVSTGAVGTRANPRSLGSLLESYTVWVWGYDNQYPTNELAQYIAARELYDEVYRACYLHGRAGGDPGGLYPLNSPKRDTVHVERPFGAEIEAVGMISAMHPDRTRIIVKGPPPVPVPHVSIHLEESTS